MVDNNNTGEEQKQGLAGISLQHSNVVFATSDDPIGGNFSHLLQEDSQVKEGPAEEVKQQALPPVPVGLKKQYSNLIEGDSDIFDGLGLEEESKAVPTFGVQAGTSEVVREEDEAVEGRDRLMTDEMSFPGESQTTTQTTVTTAATEVREGSNPNLEAQI